jgi:sugar lactone lactonase YvrE
MKSSSSKWKSVLLVAATALTFVFSAADGRATGLAFDQAGNLYFLTSNPCTIYKFTPAGAVTKFATAKTASADWQQMVVDRSGNVFVSDLTNNRRGDEIAAVLKFTPQGKRLTFIAEAGKGAPTGMTFDAAGNFLIGIEPLKSPAGSSTIMKFTPLGKPSGVFARDLDDPTCLSVDPAGNLFFCDRQANAILKLAADGSKSTVATDIEPYDLALDGTGKLFAAIFGKGFIAKIDKDGAVSKFAEIASPWFLAFDRAGNLLVLGGEGIFKLAPDGSKTLFAKNPLQAK